MENGMLLTVIIPARNEEQRLDACLRSLVAQSAPGWVLGEHWELLVVDDGSTDRTAEIARAVPGVAVLPAHPLAKGWTGKLNALETGVQQARGEWLLLLGAGVLMAPDALSRSVVEADRANVGMLSWEPRRDAESLGAKLLLPLVLSEIATAYPPTRANEPGRQLASASSQCVLVRAAALALLGGLVRFSSSPVAEVDLAFAAKGDKRVGLRFRYAPEMLAVASHAPWSAWVRKLALLLPSVLPLALWRLLDFALLWGLPVVALLVLPTVGWNSPRLHLYQGLVGLFWLRSVLRIGLRARRSQQPWADVSLAVLLGLPVFAALCWASWNQTRLLRRVSWRGREYPVGGR